MKVFLFSDLHVHYKQLDNIAKFVEGNDEIKALVFSGDLLNMGEPIGYAERFIVAVKKLNLPLLWVPGNNDFGRGYHKINSAFRSLEGRVVEFGPKGAPFGGGRKFAGVGGSPASWSGQYAGESIIDKKSIAGTIFVSHVPPPGVHNYQKHDCKSPIGFSADAPRSLGEVGSTTGEIPKRVRDDRPAGRRLSDAPLVHICGHVHTQWGCAYLGRTKVIKLAPAETGFYAIMDLENLAVEFNYFKTNRIL